MGIASRENEILSSAGFNEFYEVDLALPMDYTEIDYDPTRPDDNANNSQIFAQDGAPTTDYREGDLWFDTNDDNHIYRANSALAWVSTRDGTIATAQAAADGKITTFYQDDAPTATTIGDLWIDTNDGNKLYRATAVGAGDWVEVQDDDIATAISDAGTAQATADGKIVCFYQSGVPTATDAGDLWVDTDDGKMYRATAEDDNEITAGEWVRVDVGLNPGLIDALSTTNGPADAGATAGADLATNVTNTVAENVSGARNYEAVVHATEGDYTTIAAALAAGKTKIYVRAGVYLIDSSIDISGIDNLAIVGEDRFTTIIKNNGFTSAGLFQTDNAGSNILFKNLLFNGDNQVGSIGIESTGTTNYIYIENCVFNHFADSAIKDDFVFAKIIGNIFNDNVIGINLAHGSNIISNNQIFMVAAGDKIGIKISSTYNVITNNYIFRTIIS